MSLSGWLERHRRSLLFVAGVLVISGSFAAVRSPVALFPRVDFPRIVVSVDAGDRPADRMALEVTRPLEEQLRGIQGVRRVRSKTSRGTAEVSVEFGWGDDMIASLLLAESAVNRLSGSLPPGTVFELRRMDPTVFPVLGYSLTSPIRSGADLYELANYDLRPMLAGVEGVGRAAVLGGDVRELRVTVDPLRLAADDLTFADVANALRDSNIISAVGRLEDLHHLYLIISEAQTADLEAIGDVVLRSSPAGAVLVSDVATVAEDVAPRWTRVVADGQDAVILQVYQQPRANTVAIARDVNKALEARRKTLPPDIQMSTWYDQSELILASEASVRDSVIIGVLLACLVIFVFLRSLRITLTAVLVVPAVLAMTALVLLLLGQSLNVMTLGGMAAAVGLIIDDLIVMIEHITARHGKVAPLRAAGELTRPLVVSSTVTIIVFAPLAFLSGVSGAFFVALALTIASALIISFFMAWLIVPLLAERLLGDEGIRDLSETPMGRRYERSLRAVVRRPILAILAVVPLLAGGWVAWQAVGSGFMPATDEGGFILDYRAAPGASLSETDRLCRQVEAILAQVPEVRTYSRRTGIQLGGGLTEANEGDYFIRLKHGPRRPVDEVMTEVRARVAAEVPGLQIEMAQLMEDLIGDLTAVPQPIEVIVYGLDSQALIEAAGRVAEALSGIPGVVDINDGVIPAGDALTIEIDPLRAAVEGLTPAAIQAAIAEQLDGSVSTQVQRDPQMIDVRVWVPRNRRARLADVGRLSLRAPDGHLFPLRRVATVTRVSGQPQITRDDLRRMVAITGRIEGRDMGSVMVDVRKALASPGVLGPPLSFRLGGLYAEQQAAFAGLVAVFAAAVALVFIVLLFAFERFFVALSMMATALLSICAVLLGLWLTDTPLNVSSIMGMTMIVGIVTEVAVFYVTAAAAPAAVPLEEALVAAGMERARPILMTSLAAILALLPLALAIGEGSSMQQPLAIAIISGLIAQIPLVLLVLPALLGLLRSRPVSESP